MPHEVRGAKPALGWRKLPNADARVRYDAGRAKAKKAEKVMKAVKDMNANEKR